MKRLLPLFALLASAAATADEAQIRKALTEAYPEIPIRSIEPSPIPNLYEVYAGGRLVYSDPTGAHLVLGPLVDTKTKKDLTEARLDALGAIKFDSLPLDKAIKIVHGDGKQKLAVFSDPDCPHCRDLEHELARLQDATVYVFMTPLTEIHPDALAHANAIWCSKDRAKSWEDFMLSAKTPADAAKCDTPVSDILDLAKAHDINGTPTLVFANGKRVSGGLPANQIEALLKQGS